jgi:hypothetical protein
MPDDFTHWHCDSCEKMIVPGRKPTVFRESGTARQVVDAHRACIKILGRRYCEDCAKLIQLGAKRDA